MWMEELDNGKYKYVERYRCEKTGRDRRVSVTLTSKSRQAWNKAQAELNQRIFERTSPDYSDGFPYTFDQMFKKFTEFQKLRVAKSTYYNYFMTYNHIRPASLSNYLLDKITMADIQALVDECFNKELSTASLKKIKTIVSLTFKHAEKFYDFSHSINFQLVTIPELRKKKETGAKFIDSKDLKQVIEKMYTVLPELEADLAVFQINSGLRFGETIALTVNDWNGETVNISKSICSFSREVTSPKNQCSIRTIHCNQAMNDIIRRRIKWNQLTFGDKSHYIFANSHNNPVHIVHQNKVLKRVNPAYTTHTMRHTHISLLAEKGMPLKYIMERVGHNNPKTTLKVYTHVSDKMLESNNRKLDHLF